MHGLTGLTGLSGNPLACFICNDMGLRHSYKYLPLLGPVNP